MHVTRPLISLFGTACLVACSAGTNAPGPGHGGAGGSNSAGSAGTNGGPGAGGGGGTMGAGGTFNFGGSGGGGGGKQCGLQNFDVERKPAEILLLLDRSKSMIEDTTSDGVTLKWNAVLPALKQVIMDTDSAVSWGLKTFPEGVGAECVVGSVTPAVVVPVAPMNAAAVVGALNDTTNVATQPQGNGTPTGDAVTAAAAYLRSLTSTNPKYILLATDGAPSCANNVKTDSARMYSYDHTMAEAMGTPPIYTFVVGVATNSNSETTTLNTLADAGGRPRPGLLTHFYLGNTTAELTAALAQITGQAATCTFPLNPSPPVMNDPDKLGVYFPTAGNPMTKVPYDATMANGWAYTDANDTAVQVYGSWCDMIKASGANTVQIIYGCPGIPVP